MIDEPEQTTEELIANLLKVLRSGYTAQDRAREAEMIATQLQLRLDGLKAGKRLSL